MRDGMQVRVLSTAAQMKTRDDGEKPVVEGYFIVFNKETELWRGCFERIEKKALDGYASMDVRALINHDSTLVLGRASARTLRLSVDDYGLFGSVDINPDDADAMNLYARVKRGDVDQCSFGFDITQETVEYRDNGDVAFIVTGLTLHEISVCTFPAYEATSVKARKISYEEDKKRALEAKRKKLRERVNQWR